MVLIFSYFKNSSSISINKWNTEKYCGVESSYADDVFIMPISRVDDSRYSNYYFHLF